MNDTVVIYDRIRENLLKYTKSQHIKIPLTVNGIDFASDFMGSQT